MDEPTPNDTVSELLAVGRQISAVLASPAVSPLYMQHFATQAAEAQTHSAEWPMDVHRVCAALKELQLGSATRIYRVAPDYYAWPLYQRALSVCAPSPHHMCKTVVMANTRWRPGDATPQNVCVIVQYTHTIGTQAMADAVRGHYGKEGCVVSRKRFNFRLADEAAAFAMTGFGHNGVAPIGMLQSIPVILSASIAALRPPVLWIGAGDVDFKMAMPVAAFVDATGCLVADISAPATNKAR
ncbi:hypothetical protein GGI23_001953 [Coemansia sp. RSA 2559]|nr:hypothetical protein GGI23_001953 [Coemansia sp. RSA 2559]